MEVPQALSLVAAVLVLPGLVARLQVTLVDGWQRALQQADPADPGPALQVLGDLVVRSAVSLAPLIGAVALSAVAARALLGGVHLNSQQLKPKFKQLNVFAGLKNLVSARQAGQLARLFVKMGALGLVTYLLWDRFVAATFVGPASLSALLAGIGEALKALLLAVLALSVVAAGVDGTVAVRRYRKDLRMTKQEVKEDSKASETNPQLKAEIRARQRKMSRLRMMAEVARADVVITNPTHLAVALRYEPGSPAPKVVAKGADHMAARIRQVATEAGVPLRENKPLARALYGAVEIGDLIPVHLFQAVAEVLAVVYRMARPSPRAGSDVTPAAGGLR